MIHAVHEEPGSITLDDSRWPLIVITTVGIPSEPDFARYLRELSSLRHRPQRRGVIIDLTRADRAPPAQREAQARWLSANDDFLRLYCAGTALVITNPLVRGALTAILWLQRPSYPYVVVKTRAEAETWIAARLADELE